MNTRIPRTRAARGATVARLAAEQAARTAGTHAANFTRSPEDRRVALERRHLDAAEQVVNVLGTMKGAAMKFGQMLSVLDLGVLPEEDRERFRTTLAALRDSAPTVPFERMVGVIETELGPVDDVFADLDPEPLAAASIGQVFRGTLKDGRRVAVKVRYPGIAVAVRADLKNIGLLARIAKPIAPGVDFSALIEELRERMLEELDYRLEAANQAAAREAYAGHETVYIPEVHTELCGERVLVTELVEGDRHEALEAAPQAVRDRVGEIVYRYYCGGMYQLGRFSGDPHPGNHILMADGRVAFLDFGFYKSMDPVALSNELTCQRLAAEHRGEELKGFMGRAGFLQDPDVVDTDRLLDYMRDVIGWYIEDTELEMTPAMATDYLLTSGGPGSEYFSAVRMQNLPAEHLLARRTEAFTVALLGQLRARGNWHRIAREWMYATPAPDAPAP